VTLLDESFDVIEPNLLRWIVPGFLPAGKIVLLTGDGGCGKSSIALSIAADGSRGRPALGLQYDAASFETLLISCEDDPSGTIAPRLFSHDADMSRVRRIKSASDGLKNVGFHLGQVGFLRKYLQARKDIRLIVVDPAPAFVWAARADDHRESELRSLLGPLSDLATEFDVTFLLLVPLNRGAGYKAAVRAPGVVGYVNVSRAAFLVVDDPDDCSRRWIRPLKTNLSASPPAIAYRLTSLEADEAAAAVARMPKLPESDKAAMSASLYRVAWDTSA